MDNKHRDELIRQLNMFNEWIQEAEDEETWPLSEWTYCGLCDWIAHRRRILGELARIHCDLCGELTVTYEDEDSSDMYCDPCMDIMEAARAEQDVLFP